MKIRENKLRNLIRRIIVESNQSAATLEDVREYLDYIISIDRHNNYGHEFAMLNMYLENRMFGHETTVDYDYNEDLIKISQHILEDIFELYDDEPMSIRSEIESFLDDDYWRTVYDSQKQKLEKKKVVDKHAKVIFDKASETFPQAKREFLHQSREEDVKGSIENALLQHLTPEEKQKLGDQLDILMKIVVSDIKLDMEQGVSKAKAIENAKEYLRDFYDFED